MIRPLYTLLGVLIAPLLNAWLHRRAARGKELRARLRERFGRASQPRPDGTLIWLHAASVGEAQSVLTLARSLLARHGAAHLLITTGTVTSAALIAGQNLPRTIHQFIPVDTYPAVRRFLRHWQPNLALWVESEFWPQLLWQLRARQVPVLLINARISEKTAANWQRFPRSIRSILAAFSAVYAGSAADATRLRTLGAATVYDVGNVKYDAAVLPVDDAALVALNQAIGDRPVWLAASTHEGEETCIAAIHLALAEEFPELLTILVPRHAVRGDAIAEELRALQLTVAQRSKNDAPTSAIYLADTMGELGLFYRLCDLVFIGGSLIPHGGHNPLEAARLDCAIVTGAHTHNFTEIVAQLQAYQAILVIENDVELQATIAALLRDVAARETLADNARACVDAAHGASAKILQHVEQSLGGA